MNILRIGLVRYDQHTVSEKHKNLKLECYICGTFFKLQSVVGLAADAEHIFLGNVCPQCQQLDSAALRAELQHNADNRYKRARTLARQTGETAVAQRLEAEASERQHYAQGNLQLPTSAALTQAQHTQAHWEQFPLLKGSTAATYQGWFAPEALEPGESEDHS